MKKVNITLDERLLDRIDETADEMYTSRSGFVALACTQYLASIDASNAIKDIAFLLRKISSDKQISEEDKKKLEDFEVLARMLGGGT